MSSVVAKMRGEEGTPVSVKVIRSGKSHYLTFDMKRANIETDTVKYQMLEGNIGYIAVSAFDEVTKKQFNEAVDDLEAQDEKGLIIDLRNNGGGRLDTAVSMLDRILPKELVVYVKDKQGTSEKYYAEDNDKVEVPIAVLVNENSASASEVFSGALQDYGVAKLVGTTTFGKGIVQTIFDLKDGSALKMTTAKYYTPNGRNIHGTGLEPDVEVKYDADVTEKLGEYTIDNQLSTAVDTIETY